MARISHLKFRVMCRLLELGDAGLDECHAYGIARYFTQADGRFTERTSVDNCLKELRREGLADSQPRDGKTASKRCHWLTDSGIEALRDVCDEMADMIPILSSALERARENLRRLPGGEQ